MSPNDSTEKESIQIVDISEFFSADLTGTTDVQETSEQQNLYGEIDSPIKELKAIILSLDWEITDEIADSFISEVDRLSDIWHNDKAVASFLQILRALGKYLRTHKADAHPDSVNLLYSVYNNFEKIVLTDEITPEQEQAILNEELEKFNSLKKKIASAFAAASEGRANDSLLSALKRILLDIDWQITDQTMHKFDLEITKLEQIWRTNTIFLTPLQMMRAIGGYINKNKQDSLPDSIKLLNNVFEHFEKISLNEGMTNEERQDIIDLDLEQFTLLKQQISAKKTNQESRTPTDLFQTISEEAASLPAQAKMPGQLIDNDYEADEIDISTVVPIGSDPADAMITPSDLPPATEVTTEEVDTRLDNLFGMDDQELDITPLPGKRVPLAAEIKPAFPPEDITPLPDNAAYSNVADGLGEEPKSTLVTDEITAKASKLAATCHTDSLQRIIDEIDQRGGDKNLEVFSAEIENLRSSFPEKSPQMTIMQLIASVSNHRKTMAIHANPYSVKLLLSLGRDLCQTEREENHLPQKLVALTHSAVEKYVYFQDSVILPSMTELHTREEEIKEILGLRS